MTFFQRFFRSKCCWALLIFVILIVGIFLKIFFSYLAQDDAENWYPYFIFSSTQECALNLECRTSRDGNVAYRSLIDPGTYEDIFFRSNFYFPVKQTPEGETLFIQIRAADWQCREVGSNLGKRPAIEPDRQDPRNGFVYACWPSKPLPNLE